MSFHAPSDLPSTPASQKRSLFSQHPSTTPAGPPPSYLTDKSTTPAGPPPTRSLFGSSYNTNTNTFPRTKVTPGRLNRGFGVPQSSPLREEDDGFEDVAADDAELEQDEVMEGVEKQNGFSQSRSMFEGSISSSSRGLKRSRNGKVQERQASDMAAIAKNFAQQKQATLAAKDDLVLKTEDLMSRLDQRIQQLPITEVDEAVAQGAAELDALFAKGTAPYVTREGAIGPESNDPTARAHYIASLLLQLHYPHANKPTPAPKPRFQNSTALARREDSSEALPKALLNWLNTYHTPYPDDFDAIHLHEPSPSENDRFWDTVYYTLLRGRLDRTIRLLKDAGWEHAVTALDDGADQPGYEGQQLDNINEVVARCISVLESCPGLLYSDWNIVGADWQLYRQQVRSAIRDLESFAEGSSANKDAAAGNRVGNIFDESMQGADGFSLSTASRRAESKVPWSIYENLKVVYNMVLGRDDELLLPAQDWLEASIYLTVWWDGEEPADAPLDASASLRRSAYMRQSGHGSQRVREVDVAPVVAYSKRLAESFSMVTDNPDEAVFSVNTMDPLQVGLACVLESQTESVLSMLNSWSALLATATIEIAALGGWLPSTKGRGGALNKELSSEDLLVLSYGQGGRSPPLRGIDRDTVLVKYAQLLAQRDHFRSTDGKVVREGWELAISVLRRVEDENAAQREISSIITGIELSSEASVEKVLIVCGELGLGAQVRGIAERYADSLADPERQPTAYGSALLFYARAHATTKLRELLSLLISMCLLHSANVPAQGALDEKLASLLSKDRQALRDLAMMDTEAAQLLSSSISGYATVRKLYDLRDETAAGSRVLEKKRAAATALIALIESSADCIRGGLYDPSVEGVVAIDTLVALLGECLPFLGREKRIFTRDQTFTLLRIVEDISQVGGRVRESAEDLLRASISLYRGTLPSSSPENSSMGGSWDMLASSVLVQSQQLSSQGKGKEVERAWDWRKGLDGVGDAGIGGKEVLQILRVALAREVGRGWGGLIMWE